MVEGTVDGPVEGTVGGTDVAMGEYRPLKSVGRVAQVSIAVSMVLNIIGFILNTAGTEMSASELKNLGALLNILGNLAVILAVATSLLTTGFLIVWLRRAIRNLHSLNASSARAQDWQAFSFIIPVLNLFLPMLIMQEVWKASDPQYLDDASWRAASASPIIAGYWVSLVVQILLALAAALAANESFSVALEGFSVASSIFLILIISKLSARQEAKRMLFLSPARAQTE